MLTLFLLVLLLAGCGLAIGSAVLNCLKPDHCFAREEDRTILSVWLGIIILVNVFLGISLFFPLSVNLNIITVAALLLISFSSKRNRSVVGRLLASADRQTKFGICAIALGTAAYCSQVIVWYDSGLYHIQFIKWLSEFGIVPGLSLIHWRLGIASSWYALAAPFNHGLLEGRLYSLPGGFCLFMLLGHFCLAWRNILNQRGKQQDFFIISALLLTIPVVLFWGMPNSPTADLPVITLVITAAWTLLLIATADNQRAAEDSGIRNVRLGTLLLSAGAASMKLSAAPLLAVAYGVYLFRERFSISKMVSGGVAILLMLTPLAATGIRISGCAFFPSTSLCIETPWSLDIALVAEKSKIIKEWAKWGGAPTPEGATAWNWIPAWIAAEKVCAALLILTIIASAVIIIHPAGRKQLRATAPLLAIGILGTAFMLATAPSWRFGLGYLTILPALACSQHLGKFEELAGKAGKVKWLRNSALFGMLTAFAISLHIFIVPRPSFRMLNQIAAQKTGNRGDHPHFNLLLPPKPWDIRYELDTTAMKALALFEGQVVKNRAEEFSYFTPSADDSAETCWDAPLPCSPEKLVRVRLLDPDKGITGGFARISTK